MFYKLLPSIYLRYLIFNFSIVHRSFVHGKNFKMGFFNVIQKDCTVMDNVTIEHHVLLKEDTFVGNDTFIDSYVRSSGNNYIGDNVTLRFGCTIARKVTVSNRVFISPNVMTICTEPDGKQHEESFIGESVFIGTGAVIGSGVIIDPHVIISAMAYVNKNCESGKKYIGIPARIAECT